MKSNHKSPITLEIALVDGIIDRIHNGDTISAILLSVLFFITLILLVRLNWHHLKKDWKHLNKERKLDGHK